MINSDLKLATHTATIRAIDRDFTRRLATRTLNDGVIARLTYRQATQLGFWLKPGQTIELTGDLRDNILHITGLRLISEPFPPPPDSSETWTDS